MAVKASLFITCLGDTMFPGIVQSVVKVLRKYGVEVDVPKTQTCCGQISFNSGYWNDSIAAAKQTIRAFEQSEYVVVPSGSCTSMVRCEYKELLKNEPEWLEKLESLNKKMFEFNEFLVDVLGVKDPGVRWKERAAYHTSCHMMRGAGVRTQPFTLLNNVSDLDLVPLPNAEDCCGFGGTFAVKMSPISKAMADEKIEHIEETGATVLIASDAGCMMHLQGRMERLGKNHIKVKHIAEILAGGDPVAE